MEKKVVKPEVSQLEQDNLILKEKLKQYELKEEKEELEKKLKEEEAKSKEELDKKFREEPIVGTFEFRDVEDGRLKFTYKKRKYEQLETYLLYDKKRYALPRKIVQHLIESGSYIVKEEGIFEVGKPVKEKKRKRYNFIIDAFPDPNEDISKLPNGRAPITS